jgi:hypothetical protein
MDGTLVGTTFLCFSKHTLTLLIFPTSLLSFTFHHRRPLIPKPFRVSYPKLTKLLKECWEGNPDLRPNFDDIVRRLSGEIMAEVGANVEPELVLLHLQEDELYWADKESGGGEQGGSEAGEQAGEDMNWQNMFESERVKNNKFETERVNHSSLRLSFENQKAKHQTEVINLRKEMQMMNDELEKYKAETIRNV